MKPKVLTLPDSCGACMWGYSISIRDQSVKPYECRTVIECRHDYGRGVNEMWYAPPDWCPLRKEAKE